LRQAAPAARRQDEGAADAVGQTGERQGGDGGGRIEDPDQPFGFRFVRRRREDIALGEALQGRQMGAQGAVETGRALRFRPRGGEHDRLRQTPPSRAGRSGGMETIILSAACQGPCP